MALCAAIKRNGERCTLSATTQQGFCWAHDPANAEKRSRMASKAARSKPNKEIRDLKRQLQELAENVLSAGVDRSDASVVNQILNTRARLIEIERKIKETEELEERIEMLEQAGEQGQRGGRSWGA